MANCVLIQARVCATDVSALNRKGVATVDVQNGQILECKGLTGKEGEKEDVFTVSPVSTKRKDVWMAYTPETSKVEQGINTWRGVGSVDPRDFINKKGIVFDMFKPVAGVDVIQVSKDFFETEYDPKTVGSATYVEIQSNGKMRAVAEASPAFEGLQFRILDKHDFIIANGNMIGGEKVDGWYLECTVN